jgi:hypothetical protein
VFITFKSNQHWLFKGILWLNQCKRIYSFQLVTVSVFNHNLSGIIAVILPFNETLET